MLQSRLRISLSALLLALLLAACGGAEAQVSAQDLERNAIDEVRSTLAAADAIASDYGRRHLGHYLDLSVAKLVRKGLTVPDGMRIELKTDHTRYCLIGSTDALPAEHPWAIATVSRATQEPSHADRCSAR